MLLTFQILFLMYIAHAILKKIKNLKDDELRKYYEDIAREDLDYLKNGERVFVNVSGD